jgi:hypothetical protein
MPETHRCEGKLRGFYGAQCERRGSIERDGHYYCKTHDPAPVKLDGPPSYVWEVWQHALFSAPSVTRYRLVKMNAKGGATVLKNGFPIVLPKCDGKRLFTDESALLEYLANWHAGEVLRTRRKLAALAEVAEDPLRGVSVQVVLDARPERVKNLKL